MAYKAEFYDKFNQRVLTIEKNRNVPDYETPDFCLRDAWRSIDRRSRLGIHKAQIATNGVSISFDRYQIDHHTVGL